MRLAARSTLSQAKFAIGFGVSIMLMVSSSLAQTSVTLPSDSTTDRLQRTQKALQKAREKAKTLRNKSVGLEQDIVRIRDDLVAAARVIQNHEGRLAEISDRIETLNANQVRIRETFERRRG